MTTGDDQSIHIGGPATGPNVESAIGGFGGDVAQSFQRVLGDGGNGGDATSESIGSASGNSQVNVVDFARGGRGGRASTTLPEYKGGNGGIAKSIADARNRGTRDVTATSLAVGGAGGQERGLGGDADSFAMAEGLGNSFASSDATGGLNRFTAFGSAHATATSDALGDHSAVSRSRAAASTGTATSTSELTNLGPIATARVLTRTDFATGGTNTGTSLSHLRLNELGQDPFLSGVNTFGVVSVSEIAPVVLADSFAEIALGTSNTADEDGELFKHEVIIDFILDIDVNEDSNPLALVMPSGGHLQGWGFESLRFSVENGSEVVVDRTFTRQTEAAMYFGNTILALDTDSNGGPSKLKIIFEVESDLRGGGFKTRIDLKQIPEPGTAVLLSMGLVMVAIRGRQRSIR
jgi:hypothetical protein